MLKLFCFSMAVFSGIVGVVSGTLTNLKYYELVGKSSWIGWAQIVMGAGWIFTAALIVVSGF